FRREHSASSTLRTDWRTAREAAKFAYAGDERILVFPYCRMLKEHLACVRNASISTSGKKKCVTAVLKRFAKQWKYFVNELMRSPVDALLTVPVSLWLRRARYHARYLFGPPH